MSEHTPGPWTVAENGDDVVTAYEDSEGSILVIAEKCGPDADLVSAAPDLLEALEEAVECGMVPKSSAKDGGASSKIRHVQVADQIRNAIAKARGESNE